MVESSSITPVHREASRGRELRVRAGQLAKLHSLTAADALIEVSRDDESDRDRLPSHRCPQRLDVVVVTHVDALRAIEALNEVARERVIVCHDPNVQAWLATEGGSDDDDDDHGQDDNEEQRCAVSNNAAKHDRGEREQPP